MKKKATVYFQMVSGRIIKAQTSIQLKEGVHSQKRVRFRGYFDFTCR